MECVVNVWTAKSTVCENNAALLYVTNCRCCIWKDITLNIILGSNDTSELTRSLTDRYYSRNRRTFRSSCGYVRIANALSVSLGFDNDWQAPRDLALDICREITRVVLLLKFSRRRFLPKLSLKNPPGSAFSNLIESFFIGGTSDVGKKRSGLFRV